MNESQWGNEDYILGANAAWELAKKVFCVVKDGGLSDKELIKIFGVASVYDVMNNNTGIEAVKKYKGRNKKK